MTNNILQIAQEYWSSMTAAQIAKWQACVDFYQPKQKRSNVLLNAQQFFLRDACIRLWANLTPLTDPVLNTIESVDIDPTLTLSEGPVLTLGWTGNIQTSDYWINFKITKKLKVTNLSFRRFFKFFYLDSASTTSMDITEVFQSCFYYLPEVDDLVGVSYQLFSKTGPHILPSIISRITVESA